MINRLLGLLAVADVFGDAVGTDEFRIGLGVALHIHPHRVEFDGDKAVLEVDYGAAVLAFKSQFHVGGSAGPGAPFIEDKLRALDVLVKNDCGVVLPDQFVFLIAQESFDPVAEKTEAAAIVQRVDDVRRIVDKVAVPLFRLLELYLEGFVLLLQSALVQRVFDGLEQLFGFVGFAQEVVSTVAQSVNCRLNSAVAGDNDD